jgi:hypothetical protein
MADEGVVDARTTELLRQTGVDLSGVPPVMNTEQLAQVLGLTAASLEQDRYRTGGTGDCIPYVKIGRRVRYLRADVCQYLTDHRSGGDGGT